jgi:hypothetical protein
VPVIAALAAEFPEARLTLEYADEDIGSNSGSIVFDGGRPHTATKFDRKAAAALWFELNRCDPRDRGYDPVTSGYVGDGAGGA